MDQHRKRTLFTASAIALAALLVAGAPARAASGGLDPGFNPGGGLPGTLSTRLGGTFGAGIADMAIQPDGKLVLAGSLDDGVTRGFAIARVLEDGQLDPTFSPAGTPGVDVIGFDGNDVSDTMNRPSRIEIGAIAVRADGQILAVGRDRSANLLAVRYRIDGSLDPAFGRRVVPLANHPALANGAVDFAVMDAALQPDGKVVIALWSSDGTIGRSDFVIVRLRSDGTLDPSFGRDGLAVTDVLGIGAEDLIRAVAVQADGRIVAAGSAYDARGRGNAAVVRYNVDGSIDTAFSPSNRRGGAGRAIFNAANAAGRAQATWLESLAIAPDGTIFLGGTTHQDPELWMVPVVAALTSNGRLDRSFSGRGFSVLADRSGANSVGTAIALQGDGKLVALSEREVGDEVRVSRLLRNGARDPFFDTTIDLPGVAVAGTPRPRPGGHGLAVQNDRVRLFVGFFPRSGEGSVFLAQLTGGADEKSPLNDTRMFLAQAVRDFGCSEASSGALDALVEQALGSQGPFATVEALSGQGGCSTYAAEVIRLHLAASGRTPSLAAFRSELDRLRDGRATLRLVAGDVAKRTTAGLGSVTHLEFVLGLEEIRLGRDLTTLEIKTPTKQIKKLVSDLELKKTTRGAVLLGFAQAAGFRSATEAEVFVYWTNAAMLERTLPDANFDTLVRILENGWDTRKNMIRSYRFRPEYAARFFAD